MNKSETFVLFLDPIWKIHIIPNGNYFIYFFRYDPFAAAFCKGEGTKIMNNLSVVEICWDFVEWKTTSGQCRFLIHSGR